MGDEKKPNNHSAPEKSAHDNEVSSGVRAAAGKTGDVVVHTAIDSVEHQIVRVSVQAVERMAGTINAVLRTLPSQVATAFEKVVETGKFGAGFLKYVPGVGVVAAGAGGAAEYIIATKLGESHLDAAVNALTSTVVGVGAAVTGAAALPAAAVSFAACEVVREGLHAAGVGVEPSLIHQQLEASLKAYPERLKKELSINEAKAALKDPNSEQYQAMVAQYKQDYAILAENYREYKPLGFPSKVEDYVGRRLAEVSNSLVLVAGDAPSGILRLGKGAPAKDKRAEVEPTLDDVLTAPAAAQTVEPPPTMGVATQPAAPSPAADTSPNMNYAALLVANDFQRPATSCKASDIGDASLGCVPIQQASVAQVQGAVAAR